MAWMELEMNEELLRAVETKTELLDYTEK